MDASRPASANAAAAVTRRLSSRVSYATVRHVHWSYPAHSPSTSNDARAMTGSLQESSVTNVSDLGPTNNNLPEKCSEVSASRGGGTPG